LEEFAEQSGQKKIHMAQTNFGDSQGLPLKNEEIIVVEKIIYLHAHEMSFEIQNLVIFYELYS